LARKSIKYVASRKFMLYNLPPPPGNMCILEGVHDWGQGKRARPVPAPLMIYYNPGRGWRETAQRKKDFGSELFSNKLASLK
jgi:hypothetical protein